MNEQIEKLVIEAFFDESTNGADQKMYTLGEEKIQKFAELIVRECLCKIENEAAQYAEPAWAVELVNDIKEHFGVEE